MSKSHNHISRIKFINKAVYPRGENELKKFINKELKYPLIAKKNKIEGKVYLKFKINPKGKTYDVIVLRGIGYGCDKEAQRIVSLLKYEPAKNFKLKVTTYKKITIKFILPKDLKDEKIKINYIIT